MTDETGDLTGPQGSEPALEESLDAWNQSDAGPAWSASSDPAAPGGRLRRPSSLRATLDAQGANVPRRSVAPPPQFHVGDGPSCNPATPARSRRPNFDPALEVASSLSKRLIALTDERPEVGLGVAFVGGLVIATIIKRLARR